MFSVLSNGVYRRLFLAQVVALLGTGLLTVALGLFAYELAGDDAGAVLGTALTIKMLAYVLVAPLMTALTAHLPRKPVLITADLARAAMALCLPLISEVWQIYLLTFVLHSASAIFTPTFQSAIPAILPEERDYTRALSLSRLAYDLEALVSPVLAAALLAVFSSFSLSFDRLFLGTTAGFLFSALMVMATVVPPPGPGVVKHGSLWERSTRGIRVFWRSGSLRALWSLNLVVAAATALVLVNSIVYVRELFDRPATDLTVALGAYGGGSILVALTAPRLLARLGLRRVMLGGAATIPVLLGGATGLGALTQPGHDWGALLALWFLLGAANSAILTPSSRLLRDASEETDRSHVFAAQFALSHACFVVTYSTAGWVGAGAGLTTAAAILALLAILGTAGAFRSWPRAKKRSR